MKRMSFIKGRAWAVGFIFVILGGFILSLFEPLETNAAADIKSITWEAKLLPAADDGTFGVEVVLKSPQSLKVGDLLTTGPRSAEKISGFALGWLDSTKIEEQCVGISNQKAEISNQADGINSEHGQAGQISNSSSYVRTSEGEQYPISNGQNQNSDNSLTREPVNSITRNPQLDNSQLVTRQPATVLPFLCNGAELSTLETQEVLSGQALQKRFGTGGFDQEPPKSGNYLTPVIVTESGSRWSWVSVYTDETGNYILSGPEGQVLPGCLSLPGFPFCVPIDNSTVYPIVGGSIQALMNMIDKAILSVVNNILSAVFGFLNEVLHFVFSYTVGPGIEALLAIETHTDEFAEPIFQAWRILRNLANIMFILAIIAIGLATIFRIGGWQARDMLVKLVIGAVLINFSLVIGQTVLGVADTLQAQFMAPDSGGIRVLGNELILRGKGLAWQNFKWGGTFGTFQTSVLLIFGFLVSFAAFIAFIALLFYLLIRIIALWILLMVSPIAYAAYVLPITRNFTKTWWSKFIKYAFMTPVVAFMLNLTALIAQEQREIIHSLADDRIGNLNDVVKAVMYAVVSQAVIIAFVFASIKSASWVAGGTEKAVSNVADKGWRAAMAPGKGAGRAAGRLAEDKGNRVMARYLQGQGLFSDKKWDITKYANPLKYLKPSDTDKTNPLKRWTGYSMAKRQLYNVFTGGAYSDRVYEEGKAKLSTAQTKVKNRAQNFRNAVVGKALTAEDYEAQKVQNEKIREYGETIKNLDTSVVISQLEEQMRRGIKSMDDFSRWMAMTNKIAADMEIDSAIGRLGVGDIEGLYAYAAKQGMDDKQMAVARQMLNTEMHKQGRLDRMVRYDTPMDKAGVQNMARAYDTWVSGGRIGSAGAYYTYTDASGAVVSWDAHNKAYRQRRFGLKNEEQQAKDVPAETLFTINTSTTPPTVTAVSDYAGDWVRNLASLNFAIPADLARAREMIGYLSSEKKRYMRQVLNNPALRLDLETATGLPHGTGPGTSGRAIGNLDMVIPM